MFKGEAPPDGGQENKEKLNHAFDFTILDANELAIAEGEVCPDLETAKAEVRKQILQLKEKNRYKNKTIFGVVDEKFYDQQGDLEKFRGAWECDSNNLEGQELNGEFHS